MRKAILAVALVAMMATVANAQFVPFERIALVGGVGAGIPLRDESFTANNVIAFYKVMNVEANIYTGFSGGVDLYATYDGAIFGGDEGFEGVDVVTWGGGSLVWASLNSTQSVRAGLKLGATNNLIEGETPEWQGQSGGFIDIGTGRASAVRFGCDVRTLSNSMQIESVFPYVALKLSPGK